MSHVSFNQAITLFTWAAQAQFFRGSNKLENETIFLSSSSPTVGHKQKSGTKKISSIFDKTFLSKRFLITNEYASCSALIRYYVRYYSTYFARNATRKIRTQEIKLCRLTVRCASHRQTIVHSSAVKVFVF